MPRVTKSPSQPPRASVKVLADMHVAPAFRRWGARLGLAVVVAIGIGYVPAETLRRDPRALRLELQLGELAAQGRELAAGNAAMYRDVQRLRSDVGAIEERARADLGMVYPDEVVLRIRHDGAP